MLAHRSWFTYSFKGTGNQVTNNLCRHLLFGGLMFIATLFALTAVPLAPKNPDSFVQWLVSYEYGLTKRGLVGSLLQNFWFRGPISLKDMLCVSNFIALFAWALFVVLSIRVWFLIPKNENWIITFIVICILIATPIGIIYYVSTSHNLEVVNLFLLAAIVNLFLSRPCRMIADISLLFFSILSVLIHELALLSTIPIAMAAYSLTQRISQRSIIILAGVYLICGALVVVAGGNSREVARPAVYHAVRGMDTEFSAAIGPKIQDRIDVLQFTFVENLKKGFRSFSKVAHVNRAFFTMLIAGPAICFLSIVIFQQVQRGIGLILIATGLMPLSLILLADDIFRWAILTVVGLSILALVAGTARRDHMLESIDVAGPEAVIGFGILALLASSDLPYPYFLNNDGNPLFGALHEFARFVERSVF
jgi:hypothetical protein